MTQFNLVLYINKNDIYHLDHLCTIIKEGWVLVHFDSHKQEDTDTKVVLIRKFDK